MPEATPRSQARSKAGLRRVAAGLGCGLVAGGVALALDSALALLTGGPAGWSAQITLIYLLSGLVSGVLAAGLVAIAARVLGRHLRAVEIGALALLLPYLVPLWERLDALLRVGLLAAVATPIAVASWLLLLHRLSKSLWGAAVLTAWTASVALTVNRNLLDAPLAPTSLAADAAILLIVVALAIACRRTGPGRTLAAVGTVLAISTLASLAVAGTSRSDRPLHMATGNDVAGEARLPHILLLTVDTLRRDIFGDVTRNTPEGLAFMDAMAGAAVFDQARAPSPWTAPSVATLMTGLLPEEHGYGVRT